MNKIIEEIPNLILERYAMYEIINSLKYCVTKIEFRNPGIDDANTLASNSCTLTNIQILAESYTLFIEKYKHKFEDYKYQLLKIKAIQKKCTALQTKIAKIRNKAKYDKPDTYKEQ